MRSRLTVCCIAAGKGVLRGRRWRGRRTTASTLTLSTTLSYPLQAQLQELQALHGEEVAALQESSSKQLSAHVKTADRIIRELESTASTLQVRQRVQYLGTPWGQGVLKGVGADCIVWDLESVPSTMQATGRATRGPRETRGC